MSEKIRWPLGKYMDALETMLPNTILPVDIKEVPCISCKYFIPRLIKTTPVDTGLRICWNDDNGQMPDFSCWKSL